MLPRHDPTVVIRQKTFSGEALSKQVRDPATMISSVISSSSSRFHSGPLAPRSPGCRGAPSRRPGPGDGSPNAHPRSSRVAVIDAMAAAVQVHRIRDSESERRG
jgi:hypothetical protein